MSVFSTNQNRQFYVAKAVATTPATFGDIAVTKNVEGGITVNQFGMGGLVATDTIPVANIVKAAYTPASAMAKTLTAKKVTITDTPTAGNDYVLKVNFRQLYGMSDEDTYQKFGAVHAVKNETKKTFIEKLAFSLFKNFKRTFSTLLDVYVPTSASAYTKVASATKNGSTITFKDASNAAITVYASADNLIIAESKDGIIADYDLGRYSISRVHFEIFSGSIYVNGDETEWATVEDASTTVSQSIPNTYDIADLEYFCMGERGDQYRNVGWPKSIKTNYGVSLAETGYDTIDITYFYAGNGVDNQKSQKVITFAIPASSSANTKAILKAFVDAGVTINSIPTNSIDADNDHEIESSELA